MKKIIIQLVDDLDGTVVDEQSGRTLTFAFDGESFKIDLSNENEQRFRLVLEPYMKAASAARKGQRSTKSSPAELKAIRDWARASGIEVSARGRIAATVREAYSESNSSSRL